MQVTVLTRTLTISGVIPIIGLGLLSFFAEFNWVSSLLGVYLFGIVMFMLGTLWGQANEENSNKLAIASNILFLFTLCSYALLEGSLWLISSAAILATTFIVERAVSNIGDDYQRLRTEVTTLACTLIIIIVVLQQF